MEKPRPPNAERVLSHVVLDRDRSRSQSASALVRTLNVQIVPGSGDEIIRRTQVAPTLRVRGRRL